MPSSVASTMTVREVSSSKSGAATNVKTPVVALIAKSVSSAPPPNEYVTPSLSASVAVTVVTADVAFSA